MVQLFEFFQVSLLISVRNMFLSKSFSMSELDIHQTLRLNHYTKLKECWTDDVDGDCFSFNLYRNTESSIVLLKRWRGDFRKAEYCQIYQHCFYLVEISQIQWFISKKQNNGRAYETKIGDKKHHFDYCFEFDTITKSRFVRISFNRLSKFKRLPVVYITIYQKQSDKNVYFGNFFFHWLEIEQIEKILIEISKFELSFEKTI